MQVMRYNLSVAYALRGEWEKANNLLKEVGAGVTPMLTEYLKFVFMFVIKGCQVMGELTLRFLSC